MEYMIDEVMPGDAVVFIDGSVKVGVTSGWAHFVRVNRKTETKDSGAVMFTASSMNMEGKAVTEALLYIGKRPLR